VEEHVSRVPGGPLGVVVVDDYPSILLGIQEAARRRSIEIAAVGSSLTEVRCQAAHADVVLLDVLLADGSDVRTNVRQLTERGTSVLAFAGPTDVDLATAALGAGARDVIWKHDPLDRLFDRLTSLRAPRHPSESGGAEDAADEGLVPLSQREVEVLHMVLGGLVTKQIARALQVETSTVKEYLKRIRRKYAAQGRPATTRTDLVRRAVEDGLLEGPR